MTSRCRSHPSHLPRSRPRHSHHLDRKPSGLAAVVRLTFMAFDTEADPVADKLSHHRCLVSMLVSILTHTSPTLDSQSLGRYRQGSTLASSCRLRTDNSELLRSWPLLAHLHVSLLP